MEVEGHASVADIDASIVNIIQGTYLPALSGCGRRLPKYWDAHCGSDKHFESLTHCYCIITTRQTQRANQLSHIFNHVQQ